MKRVVVIGGGFGGLNVVKSLKNAPVEIVLLDKSNHHLFQPLLYQVATAALTPADIAAPLREVLARQANVEVFMADVTSIDLKNRTVHTGVGESYSYDILVIASGASHSYFGRPEWKEIAPGLKTLKDAITIRDDVLWAFEQAERLNDPEEIKRYMRFVIVGAGPTGVELAGAIAEISRRTLLRNFRRIKPENAEIYLIEGRDKVLPAFPDSLCRKAKRDLEQLGVTVLTSTKVMNLQRGKVVLDQMTIEAETIIWAAGNEAAGFLKTLGTPLDPQGRVIVEKDLTVPGYPEVFVIGDAAKAVDEKGAPLPGIAPVAIQEGRYVGKLIKNGLKKRPPFRYFDKGILATIGKSKAVGVIRKMKVSGFFAWLLWSTVHVLYLVNFRSRIMVMFQWSIWYFTGRRTARLIMQRRSD